MKRLLGYVEYLRNRINNSVGFIFSKELPESMLEEALAEEGVSYRKRLYTPIITLWMWIYQVLDKDKSCKNAVSNVVASIAASGNPTPSTDTGAYCKARGRLKEGFILRVVRHLGGRNQILWHGRRVVLTDGSTLTAADTVENQEEYPQPASQKDGCGFPMLNIVAFFCLFTGALLEIAIDSLRVHEINLFRRLCEFLQPGDIALGDQLYGTYANICLVKAREADSVFRIHWRRKTDFRRGKILGCYDHIVEWTKPGVCSQGLSPDLYEELPETIKVREVRYKVEVKGFRPDEVTLVTTLLDADEYPKEALAQLYELRWHVEVDFRHLKTTMRMEHLSCKTPHMIRNELYTHLLAYNLVRTLMFQVGMKHQIAPLELSFQATTQHLLNFGDELVHVDDAALREYLYEKLLDSIFKDRLPIRPRRVEPRLKKRRPKDYKYLQRPRNLERQRLIA